MSEAAIGIESEIEVPDITVEAPHPELKEFKEIPEGYVSVFTVVNKKDLDELAEEGLRVGDNQVNEKHPPEVEALFNQVAEEKGLGVSRAKSIYAYPRHLINMQRIFEFNPEEQTMLELKIDPKKAMVTNMESYDEAVIIMREIDNYDPAKSPAWFKPLHSKEDVRGWAEKYWDEAKRLDRYLAEGHTGSDEDEVIDYTHPEVLVFDDVPPSRIKHIPVTPDEVQSIVERCAI